MATPFRSVSQHQNKIIQTIMQACCENPKWLDSIRYPKDVYSRTRPPVDLPLGVAHKLTKNAYWQRDVRRDIRPASVYTNEDGKQQLLPTGAGTEVASPLPPTPGRPYHW
eukprot:Colp12_sorted_trinity150504_noHs@33060